MLHERGVAALLEAVTTDTGLPARLLARTDGERWLTDLRHVAQALHAVAVDAHLGPGALLEWLRRRIAEAGVDVGMERSRRLESDAAAVQIITIHRSKGLEFPVVYVPFGWDRNVRDPDVPLLHVGTDAGARRRRGERRGLPRALRGAPGRGGGRGPPAVLRGAHPGEVPGRPVVGAVHHHRHVAGAPAAHRAARAGHGARGELPRAVRRGGVGGAGRAGVAGAGGRAGRRDRPPAVRYTPPRAPIGELTAAAFTRSLDRLWRRTSYSALTAGAGHARPG